MLNREACVRYGKRKEEREFEGPLKFTFYSYVENLMSNTGMTETRYNWHSEVLSID